MKYPITLSHESWGTVLEAIKNQRGYLRSNIIDMTGDTACMFLDYADKLSRIEQEIKKQRDPMKKARKK